MILYILIGIVILLLWNNFFGSGDPPRTIPGESGGSGGTRVGSGGSGSGGGSGGSGDLNEILPPGKISVYLDADGIEYYVDNNFYYDTNENPICVIEGKEGESIAVPLDNTDGGLHSGFGTSYEDINSSTDLFYNGEIVLYCGDEKVAIAPFSSLDQCNRAYRHPDGYYSYKRDDADRTNTYHPPDGMTYSDGTFLEKVGMCRVRRLSGCEFQKREGIINNFSCQVPEYDWNLNEWKMRDLDPDDPGDMDSETDVEEPCYDDDGLREIPYYCGS